MNAVGWVTVGNEWWEVGNECGGMGDGLLLPDGDAMHPMICTTLAV
jgi:hypothetical protein